MPERRRNWSRSETILAFDIYCRLGFRAADKNNPEIVRLAALLNRTPSAVALKLSNLAHYDPELQARNIVGMSHGSALDKAIFEEFYKSLQDLAWQSAQIRAEMGDQLIENDPDFTDLQGCPPGDYRQTVIKQRIGQRAFRQSVLNAYDGQCCVTGLHLDELLIASHIKPWAQCDEKTERTNPCNGLCLNPFHDRAFDKGLITLDKSFCIVLSNKIKNVDMDADTIAWFKHYDHKRICLPHKFQPGKEFIEYHNDVIFLG